MLKCTKCGSTSVYSQEDGPHVGIYCCACGKWIKWANKNEKKLLERRKDEQQNDQCGWRSPW